MRASYSRWDDTQDPLGETLDVGDLLDDMADEILSGYGPEWALEQLRRRGLSGRVRGLDDLLQRLRSERRRLERDLSLSGPLAEVRDRLNEILELERAALSERTDDDARMREALLDALPHHPAHAVRELMNYDFVSPEARARFDSLLEELRSEVLNSYFSQLAGGMRNLAADDLARLKDMLADLNAMLAAREHGEDIDFDGFMAKHGDFFPENPRSLDELLEVLARRMAAMSRLLASLSDEQRRELADLARAVLDDLDLAFQIDQLESHLRDLAPQLPWDELVLGYGDEPVPMSMAVDALERIGDYEDLEHSIMGDYAGATLDDVDEDRLRQALDEDAVRDLRRLKEIEKALEDAGILDRRRGRLELTARGARLIGERSLTRLMDRIRREPTHRAPGGEAEPTGQTRPWSFGSSDPISVERTVYNAVRRAGPGRPVRLQTDDFEVTETESRPRTATALLLDLSFSMPLRGHWIHAKRMALALHALIEGKYPQDSLYVVGFSDYARQMDPADLATAGWEEVQGTNMQHAFILARRLLADDLRSTKQVIMVTDGEPTVHLDGDVAIFNWPPLPVTIESTLREAMRLSRSRISINVFMLEESPGLFDLMGRLAHVTGGRSFFCPSSEVGGTVIRDYLGGRRAS